MWSSLTGAGSSVPSASDADAIESVRILVVGDAGKEAVVFFLSFFFFPRSCLLNRWALIHTLSLSPRLTLNDRLRQDLARPGARPGQRPGEARAHGRVLRAGQGENERERMMVSLSKCDVKQLSSFLLSTLSFFPQTNQILSNSSSSAPPTTPPSRASSS